MFLNPISTLFIYDHDESHLTNYEDFVAYSIDRGSQIILNVSEIKDDGYIFNIDYGIGELNMALLCADWKYKAKPDVKVEKPEKIEKLDKAEKAQVVSKIDNVDIVDSEIPYEKFDDEDFEKVLTQMMDMRNNNLNTNLNDEERRKNAENAILLLSKYLNLDEGELDESDD
jgi:hypothetical protein